MEKLEQEVVNLIVTAVNLPKNDASSLPELLKADPKLKDVRTIALTSQATPAVLDSLEGYSAVSHRAAMLRSIENLALVVERSNPGVNALTL
jgi:CheY-like chemotaxis protein